jgi:hypothetical protein
MPDAQRSASKPRGLPCVVTLGRWAWTIAALSLLGVGVTACGSSHASAPSSNASVEQTCKQVEAVLSDGPDPEADPVGHAQAQVLPLHRIHTSDERLRQAIGRLASAYRGFFTSNGSRAAKQAVSLASKALAGICPGVAS